MLQRALNSMGTDLNVLPRWSQPLQTPDGSVLERKYFPHASDEPASYTPPTGNQILRYQFANGSWSSAPTSVIISNLRDLALSLDGTKILALADDSLTLVDPVSLARGTVTTFAFSIPGFEFFNRLAMANDGFALITTGLNGSGDTEPYLYSMSNPGFTSLFSADTFMDQAISAVSDDGSVVAIIRRSNPPVFKYVASTSVLSTTSVNLRQESQVVPALSRSGTRIVVHGNPNLNGQTATSLYDGNFEGIGGITKEASFPITQAVAIAPDGTRAYALDSSQVHAFDLTQPQVGGLFPEVGTGTAAAPGSVPIMKISPDGGTLFLAGSSGIVILSAP